MAIKPNEERTETRFDPQFLDLLVAIGSTKHAFPDLRVGQLLCNAASSASSTKKVSVWDVEDAEARASLERLLAAKLGDAALPKTLSRQEWANLFEQRARQFQEMADQLRAVEAQLPADDRETN